ncbi:MAG: hypothetical protein DRN71_01050 [Candidatus Nanohalarchaeota archaeon]|nr:MAG: hypothetical protein DRN71_01050 [Candidatus Nanohaloarchaeota archaeon]
MNKLFGILFVLIVSVSACPQQSVYFDPNAGAVLQDLSFDTPKVYDDDTVSLMFDVVNVGGKEITDSINVYIYGPTIENSSSTTEVWRLTESQPEVDPTDGYIEYSLTSADLPAPDPSLGTPGGQKPFEYTFKPATVLDGVEIPTTFYVSLCYPYSTQTLTQIEVTSKNEMRATGVQSSRKDTVNAGGPIHLTLLGSSGIRPGKIPLVFKVTDVGGGYSSLNTSCKVDLPKVNRSKVNISVSVDGNTSAKCGSGTTNTAIVRLKNGVGTVYCTFQPPATVAPRRTYIVSATATYMYYTTSTVGVTNIGSTIETS